MIAKLINFYLHSIDDKFKLNECQVEAQFKEKTVGLVSAEDYKRLLLEQDTDDSKDKERENLVVQQQVKQRQAQERKKDLSVLSFEVDDEEEFVLPKKSKKAAAVPSEKTSTENVDEVVQLKKSKAKDPTVDTSFLYDKDREEQEQLLREKLSLQWDEEEKLRKLEKIHIVYSYWDGSGHRHSVTVTKGSTIDSFLEQCRAQLSDNFHELRGLSSDSLMYIKEDLIIPSHYTFYDLIVTKARGKSGPLFCFDVHEDVRLKADARVEKDESHAGKIITRSWYDRNKHIFPASRWEIYDPKKTYEKYTIA